MSRHEPSPKVIAGFTLQELGAIASVVSALLLLYLNFGPRRQGQTALPP